jgi:hypothetical protein
LRGNNAWSDAWTLYMKRLSEEAREAAVSTYIFNPQNIAFILWEFACGNGSDDILPDLQVATEIEGRPLRLLAGRLQWDGVTHPDDPQRVFSEVFEKAPELERTPFSVRGLYLLKTFGGLRQLDAALVSAHGLSYGLTESSFDDPAPTRKPLVAVDGELRDQTQARRPFGAFLAANREYLAKLAALLHPHNVNPSTDCEPIQLANDGDGH